MNEFREGELGECECASVCVCAAEEEGVRALEEGSVFASEEERGVSECASVCLRTGTQNVSAEV